jgi:phospholipase/carboxylesterase
MVADFDKYRLVLEPKTKVMASIIWLHGLGADGHDFEAIVPELGIADELGIRFILPHAPHRPVTLNNGSIMRAWYDIIAIDKSSPQDEVGIRESEDIVHQLIQEQIDLGINAARIVLAGFSQGGAIVLHTALRYPHQLAGVLALSTYLPLADSLAQERHDSNKTTPIWMAHGTFDDVVPIMLAEKSRDFMLSQGYPLEWKQYPMPHSVCPEEIQDIAAWFKQVLK